jgi:hypothetical protein
MAFKTLFLVMSSVRLLNDYINKSLKNETNRNETRTGLGINLATTRHPKYGLLIICHLIYGRQMEGTP